MTNFKSRFPFCIPIILALAFSASISGQNTSPLNLGENDSFNGFEILDKHIPNNTVFLNGEDHRWRKSNGELDYKFFRYLNKMGNCKTLMLESGFSRGWLLNQWFQTNDTAWKQAIRLYSFDVDLPRFEKLKRLYDSLPKNKKFRIEGVDIERSYPTAIKTLALMLPDTGIPESIIEPIMALEGMREYLDQMAVRRMEDGYPNRYTGYIFGGYNTANFMDTFMHQFNTHRDEFERFLDDGGNKEAFVRILDGLKKARLWYKQSQIKIPQAYVLRERAIFKNIERLVEENPNEKFYGQFGRCHVAYTKQDEACGWYHFEAMAKLLNESKLQGLKGKVFNTAIFYKSDFNKLPNGISSTLVDSFINEVDKGSQYLFEIPSGGEDNLANQDSLGPPLSSIYSLVVINSHDLEGEFEGQSPYGNQLNPSDNVIGGPFIEISYSRESLDFQELNHWIDSLGLPSFGETIQGIRFFWGGQDWLVPINWGSYFDYKFGQTLDIGDSGSVKLKGWDWGTIVSYDVIPLRSLALGPKLDVSFGSKKFIYESGSQQSSQFLGTKETEVLTNPFFNLKLGAEARIHLGSLCINAWWNHKWDFSKTKWKYGGQITSIGPNTKTQGSEMGIGIGFWFDY